MWGTLQSVSTLLTIVGLPKARDRGKRRLGAGIGAFAFKRIQQPGFFAAHVAAGADVQVHFEAVAGAEDVLAEIVGFVGFRDGLAQSVVAASLYSPRRKI